MIGSIDPLEFLKNWRAPGDRYQSKYDDLPRPPDGAVQRNNEEYRRNQHSAAARGISGVLDTGHAVTGQPQEAQHSDRKRSGTDWPRVPGSLCRTERPARIRNV